jgi:hypothetical protein
MALFEDTSEQEPEEQKKTDYSGLIIAAALLPVVIFFGHIGEFDRGLNIAICLGVNLIAVRIRWNLRKNLWFWLVMALVTGCEIALVQHIQWPHRWVPGVELLPIGLAGVLVALGAIQLVERFFVTGREEE